MPRSRGGGNRRSAYVRSRSSRSLPSAMRLQFYSCSAMGAVWSSGEQYTVPALLERRLESDPDGEHVDVVGSKLTAAQVENTANRIANALSDLGLRQGDRVATLL